MGVSDNMLHKETLKVASSSHSEERFGRVPTENGHLAPAPKYKQRKIFAVRDFPPGCGRLAAPVIRPSEQVQVKPALLSDWDDKHKVERRLKPLINENYDLQKDLAPKNVADGVDPQSAIRSYPGESSLERTSTINYCPRREVTVRRDFPPFCGRNAPRLSKEEHMKWLNSLKSKGYNIEKHVNKEKLLEKAYCTDVKLVTEANQDLNGLEGKLDSSVLISAEEIISKHEEPVFEKMSKRGASEISSRNDMKENQDDMTEKNKEFHSETYPDEFYSKSNKASETCDQYFTGMEENAICDIAVNAEDSRLEKGHSDSSAFGDQILEVGCGSQEVPSHKPIVIGLMDQLTSISPQEKVTCKNDLADYSSKKKRKGNYIILPRADYANMNEEESHEETPTKNTSSITRKDYQGFGHAVISNKEEFFWQGGQYTSDNFVKRSCRYDNMINTRNRVREILRLFQVICRKLLQGEESKLNVEGKNSKRERVDLQAAKILKENGKYVNIGKQIIGPVPGVEVGDEFLYFAELNIVGLHRQSQGGIDYVKQGDKIIATSVIASGGYENDLDSSDILNYMGQGGNVKQKGKQPKDQKLERGNLALANSRIVKNPVRVIRGEIRSSDSSENRGKTYVYDGLYLVEELKQETGSHGKLVYKFKLVRIPGQPELAWKVVKKSTKSRMLKGLCANDISQGKEMIPICAINTVDGKTPPSFNYVPHMIYPDWCCPIPPKGCDCTNKCSESRRCSCVMRNGGEFPYNHNGAIVQAKSLVYECGPTCNCPPSCYNRVSQRGIKIQLEIFKTESRGWGVRSRNSITSGSFICEYAGELLEDREAEERKGNDEYLFDIGNNYTDNSLWDDLSTLIPETNPNIRQIIEGTGFTIDAAQYGNIGRFINHSCSPNLYAQNVLYDHDDRRIPHIMFFAAENIPPLQELTYHYNYTIDQVHDENGNIKKKICYCGSSECSGRLY